MLQLFKALLRDERGVSALEYAILAGVIVVAVVAGVTVFGDDIAGLFGNAGDALGEARTQSDAAGGN